MPARGERVGDGEPVELTTHLVPSGLFASPDPSPIANIGGTVSTNCSSTHASRQGTIKDWGLNLTVVLADIRPRHQHPPPPA
ncbi:hypothetical protein QBC39DRAFT_363076 [Podospora conica]|nr:hypothetical protein QBC39DRAFT_363076 [Schizothecium conicum]